MSTRWIQTYTGKKLHPLAARAEEIDLLDIAHALAMKCRFNGQCRIFYSVAEHSLRVSRYTEAATVVPKVVPTPSSAMPPQRETAFTCGTHNAQVLFETKILPLWGLMHDAAEAFLPDLGGPIKSAFHIHHETHTEPFDAAENRLLGVIATALKFPPIDYEQIRQADYTLLVTEARDLLGEPPEPWNMPQVPLQEKIVPLSPAESEAAFLARFAELHRL